MTCQTINMFVDSVLNTCVVCPAVAAVPAVPPRVVYSPRIGWDASAYSRTRLDGDVRLFFDVPSSIGVVVGLGPERRSNDPRDIPYGFYIWKAGGAENWAVAEAGVLKTAAVIRAPETDVFRIERRGGQVSYFHNNRIVHVADTISHDSLVTLTCLYASNDGVG